MVGCRLVSGQMVGCRLVGGQMVECRLAVVGAFSLYNLRGQFRIWDLRQRATVTLRVCTKETAVMTIFLCVEAAQYLQVELVSIWYVHGDRAFRAQWTHVNAQPNHIKLQL